MPKTSAETRIALLDLEKALNNVLFERETAIRAAILALLAGVNCIFIGPPGSAKSLTLSMIARAIKARYFQALLSMSSKPDELFGAKDANAYLAGVVKYHTNGMLPDAEIAFLDEPCKVNSATGNALLNVLNERTFVNGGQVMDLPLLAVFGGANEVPQEEDLYAYYDRFLVRVHVPYIKSATKFADMMFMTTPAQVSSDLCADDIMTARAEIDRVTANGVARDSANRVKDALATEGFTLSDRRWRQAARLMQANAWLNSRTFVSEMDMEVLVHVAWDLPEDQRRVETIVKKIANPLYEKAAELMDACRTAVEEASKRNDAESKLDWITRIGRTLKKLNDGIVQLRGLISINPPEMCEPLTTALADVEKAKEEMAQRSAMLLSEVARGG